MASVPCAIEMEPKTLNPVQINHARELAVVFHKIESLEPQDFIVEGLRDVATLDGIEQMTEGNAENAVGNNIMANHNTKDNCNVVAGSSQRCLCATIFIDSPDDTHDTHDTASSGKEPVTAPF